MVARQVASRLAEMEEKAEEWMRASETRGDGNPNVPLWLSLPWCVEEPRPQMTPTASSQPLLLLTNAASSDYISSSPGVGSIPSAVLDGGGGCDDRQDDKNKPKWIQQPAPVSLSAVQGAAHHVPQQRPRILISYKESDPALERMRLQAAIFAQCC